MKITRNPSTPIVGGRDGENFRFTVVADGLLRYEWAPDGNFEDRPSSFAALRHKAILNVPPYTVKEGPDSMEIITSRFHLTFNKQEFSPYGLSALVFKHTNVLWRYGTVDQNMFGTYRTLDGADGKVELEWGILSRNGHCALDDSNTMLFTEDGFVSTRMPGPGRVDGYLFAYGRDYRTAMKAFYALSGAPPVLPRWALGNWWSRYYAYTAKEYLKLMDDFQKDHVPLSVAIIDMDWHLVDDPRVINAGQTGWTGYTWNRKLFPDPPAFLAELHKRKLKTALNEHPADGVQPYEDLYPEFARALNKDPKTKEGIPFDITSPAFARAYFDVLISSLEKDGCDFIWTDWQQGQFSKLKGVDPLWVLNHLHHNHNKLSNPDHPLIFSRYAGPGSQRYPIGFSGDTIVSWASLDFQPYFTLTASNIGYGWWSHDIGGHMFGARDDELTTRWVQLGVFSPIMRLHSTKSPWVAKEPWMLPPGYRGVVEAFMRLRHRLLPYLHTMNVRASQEGLPLVQPMYWEWPEQENAYQIRNQYLFGSNMMVVPITTPRDRGIRLSKTKGWLPTGRWVDFFSGVKYEGDREMWLSRPLDEYPVFMKEGAIVPLDQNLEPGNGADNPTAVEIVLVLGQDGRFDMLEEAEHETNSAAPGSQHRRHTWTQHSNCDWKKTPIEYLQNSGELRLGPTSHSQSTPPLEYHKHADPVRRRWSVRLLGSSFKDFEEEVLDDLRNAWGDIREERNGVVIDLGEADVSSREVRVALGKNPQVSTNDPAALLAPVILAAQITYKVKEAIWDIVSNKNVSNIVKVSRLQALEMAESVRLAVMEMLLAE